jgi:AcrR family transcriptional regulator
MVGERCAPRFARMAVPMLMPSAQTDPRDARKAALLDAAAQEFNARGISGASIARIARALGLTRAAVYYYVKDRDDLAAQCYARTCALMAGDLTAAGAARTGLEKVLAFLRAALDPQRAPAAVLSELDCLEGKQRSGILAAHNRNIETLRGFVRAGIADGSMRICDDEIVAQTLVGTVAWIPLSVDWVEDTDESFRARTVESLIDVLTNGEAKERDFAFEPRISIETFFPEPINAFDRKAANAAKIEQLLMTASQAFNRNGIDGTSLDGIAASLGATKGTLYHYLENKTDLVVRCYRRSFDLTERFADACEKFGRNGLERATLGLYLNVQAHASGLSPLVLMSGANALPAAARREITRRARQLQKRFKRFGEEGLADGSFRDIDFDAVAQLGAGAFEWLPKWFSTDDPRAPEVLAHEITELFIRGLRAR